MALAATLAVQTLTAMTLALPPVLAPVVAPLLGYRVEQVGYLIGLAYILAMLSGLLSSSYVPRFGPIRMSQAAMFLCAAALALLTVQNLLAMALAAVLIGLAYGLTNPTSAAILGEHTPSHRRGLIFSLKQTGVPLGIALAGSMGPWLYHWGGWEFAAYCGAGLCFVIGLALQPTVRIFDHSLVSTLRFNVGELFRPLGQVFARPNLRRLALVSLIYAMIQVSLITFMVAHLTETHSMQLAHAAAILAAAQVTSIVARPTWGWLADRTGKPARLLGQLGLGTAVSCLALALVPTGWPMAALILACVACSATGIGWNGVFYAELINQAGKSELATVTGGVQFLTFLGAMGGPVLVAAIVSQLGSFSAAFVVLALAAATAAILLLISDRSQADIGAGPGGAAASASS